MDTGTTASGDGFAVSNSCSWMNVGLTKAVAAVAVLLLVSSPALAQMKLRVQQSSQITDLPVPKEHRGLASINLNGIVAGGDIMDESAPMAIIVNVTGSEPALATAMQLNERVQYVLRPPIGARFDSGKLEVFGSALGKLKGDARLLFKFGIDAVLGTGKTLSAVNQVTLGDQPGNEAVEIQVSVQLPPDIESTRDIQLLVTGLLDLSGTNQGKIGQTLDSTALGGIPTSFAVFNSAGVQVTGFKMTHKSGREIAEKVVTEPGMAFATEYYYDKEQNYFVTTSAAESARLDLDGSWRRTGESFKVYVDDRPGTTAICRFYSIKYAPDFAHRYIEAGSKCDQLKSNTDWTYEGIVFYVPLPDAAGACGAGQLPVYLVSLAADAPGVSPSYRLTTNRDEKIKMMVEGGWKGGDVAMCAPM